MNRDKFPPSRVTKTGFSLHWKQSLVFVGGKKNPLLVKNKTKTNKNTKTNKQNTKKKKKEKPKDKQ